MRWLPAPGGGGAATSMRFTLASRVTADSTGTPRSVVALEGSARRVLSALATEAEPLAVGVWMVAVILTLAAVTTTVTSEASTPAAAASLLAIARRLDSS